MTVQEMVRVGVIGLLLLGLGYGVGKYSTPAKIVTRTIVKEIEVKKEHRDVAVYSKKTTSKDGTVVEETSSIYKTTSTSEKKHDSSNSHITTRDLGLTVHMIATHNLRRTEQGYEYGVYVKKRVLGNISVGAMVTDQKTLGLSVGLDF